MVEDIDDLAKAKMLFHSLTGKAKVVIGEMSITAKHLTDMKDVLLNAFNDLNDLVHTYQKMLHVIPRAAFFLSI